MTESAPSPVVSRDQAARQCAGWRENGQRVVFTNGCFDILHAGHLGLLQQARALGDRLVVGVNSDDSVRRLKGPDRPLVTETERAATLAALPFVDLVVVFDELRPHALIEAVRPAIHVKGGDYRIADLPEAPLVESLGGQVVVLPLVAGKSTSGLLEDYQARRRQTGANERVVAVIPARYAATRFDGKVLADILGKPMIQHVYERTSRADSVESVIVATDDERVAEVVSGFGGEVAMTSPDHRSGTDRIAEATADLDCGIVVNVQGDEPLVEPAMIQQAIEPLLADADTVMSTLSSPLDDDQLENPNVVKVVVDRDGYALYFSRYPIPYHREPAAARRRHIGLYVYRRAFLQRFAQMAPTPLERSERLEQLRALEHGYRIRVVPVDHVSPGVDTPEQLAEVCRIMAEQGGRKP